VLGEERLQVREEVEVRDFALSVLGQWGYACAVIPPAPPKASQSNLGTRQGCASRWQFHERPLSRNNQDRTNSSSRDSSDILLALAPTKRYIAATTAGPKVERSPKNFQRALTTPLLTVAALTDLRTRGVCLVPTRLS
jgi:hypothetical protein